MVGSRNLRESVEQLREYMFSASAYPGPELGKMWSLGVGNAGTPQGKIYRDDEEEKDEKERADKRKKPDFRPDLRRLSLWLQQRRAQ
jgi:hypothetical protein